METLDRDWTILRERGQLIFLDDQEFREPALGECLAEVSRPPAHYRALSLTDRVIRLILSEINTKIDAFITFNAKDFVDVCEKLGLELIS
jgi:hypothetical protein